MEHPDPASSDGQRDCPKHVELYSRNEIENLVHLVVFIIRLFGLYNQHHEADTCIAKHESKRIFLQCSRISDMQIVVKMYSF